MGFEAGGGEARGNGLARDRASSRRDRVTRSIAARDSQRTRDATHAPATDTLAAMQRRLAVLLALPLAACGGHGTPGNGPGDGGADASTDAPGGLDAATDGAPDATTTRVEVVVYRFAAPARDIAVLFQNPDDSVIADVKTDAEGRAGAELPMGGNLTILIPLYQVGSTPATRAAFVILGVKPGDVIEFGDRAPLPATPASPVTLQLAQGAGNGLVQARCSGQTNWQPVADRVTIQPCSSPSNFAVFHTDELLYTDDLRFAAGDTLDLTSGAFHARHTFTVQAMNTDVGATSVVTASAILEDRGFLLDSQERNTTTGSTTLALYDLPGVAAVQTRAIGRVLDRALTIARRGPLADPTVFDFAQASLPLVDSFQFADGMVSWHEQGSGTADLAYATVLFTPATPGKMSPRLRIEVAGARQSSALRVPVFPAPYLDYNPMPGETSQVFDAAIARVAGGWDAARPVVKRGTFGSDVDWLTGELVISTPPP